MKLRKCDEYIWVMTRTLILHKEIRYPLKYISSNTRRACWVNYHVYFDEAASIENREAAKKQSFKPMKFKLTPVK